MCSSIKRQTQITCLMYAGELHFLSELKNDPAASHTSGGLAQPGQQPPVILKLSYSSAELVRPSGIERAHPKSLILILSLEVPSGAAASRVPPTNTLPLPKQRSLITNILTAMTITMTTTMTVTMTMIMINYY